MGFPSFKKDGSQKDVLYALILPKTNSSPLKIGHPERKRSHLPTIHFVRRFLSFREGTLPLAPGRCHFGVCPEALFQEKIRLVGL